MGKYFEALNLTECNDALMGVIYYSIRLAQRLIAGVMAARMCMGTFAYKARMHAHKLRPSLSSPCSAHMRVILANYHKNENRREQISQK